MNDLFDGYPLAPGYRRTDTSREAARAIAPNAATLREKCLEEIRCAPATADEVAAALQETVLSIRPRITELRALNKIKDSGERRFNKSRKRAIVWVVA